MISPECHFYPSLSLLFPFIRFLWRVYSPFDSFLENSRKPCKHSHVQEVGFFFVCYHSSSKRKEKETREGERRAVILPNKGEEK